MAIFSEKLGSDIFSDIHVRSEQHCAEVLKGIMEEMNSVNAAKSRIKRNVLKDLLV